MSSAASAAAYFTETDHGDDTLVRGRGRGRELEGDEH